MHAGLDDVLGDVLKAHRQVHGGGAELGGIDDSALQGQIDFAARQGRDADAQLAQNVHVPADGAHPQPLEVGHLGRLLVGEQTHVLAALAAGEGDQVVAAVEFLHLLKPAALIEPDVVAFRVEAERDVGEGDEILIFPFPVTRPVVADLGLSPC